MGRAHGTDATSSSAPDRATSPYNAFAVLAGNLDGGKGSDPYLITEHGTHSYEEVGAAADAVGAGLLDAGLARGDRVVIALRDRPEFVAVFWGAIKAGLVPVPVAQGLSASDAHFILTDSDAAAIFADASSLRQFTSCARELQRLLIVLDDDNEGLPYSSLAAPVSAFAAAATDEADIALWLYTSGTTGLPKAVMHRHGTLGRAGRPLAGDVLSLSSEDRVLSVSRMFFAYGLGNSVHLPASAGAAAVLNEGPVIPARINELLAATRPTILCGVPAFFSGYARLVDATLPSSVRVALSAGESLPPALFERFLETFGVPLLDGLGATEALHHFTCSRPGDVVPGSSGPPLPGYEVKVRDSDGNDLPEGRSGELWVKGPTIFAGYWRRPELTESTLRNGWLRTGDQARIENGHVWHEGRLDSLLKIGGIWVAPTEIEDVLRSHPDVIDAAVVTMDDGHGVPLVRGFLVSTRSDTALVSEVRRLCRAKLARYKVPAGLEVVPELPRTVSGKLKRYVLRAGRELPT